MLLLVFVAPMFGAGEARADVLATNLDTLLIYQDGYFFHGVEVSNYNWAPSPVGIAQKFTAGDHGGGYTLSSVEICLLWISATLSVPKVTIYTADADGNPGTLKYTLSNPASYDQAGYGDDFTSCDNGKIAFTAPSDATLESETDYFVAFENVGTQATEDGDFSDYNIGKVLSGAEGLSASGWSIADAEHYKNNPTDSWAEPTGLARPVRLRINGSTITDTTVPVLDTATVSGRSLVLTYDEKLDEDSEPAASAYSVSVDSGTGTAPSSVAVSGKKVTLTLATAVTNGQTVTVTYTKPASNPVKDRSANEAAGFTDQSVTNNTPSTNSAPVFTDGTSTTRSFTETVGAATVQTAVDIGAAVAATDDDSDPLTYTLEGTDAGKFTIVETSGQIRTKVGESYDYEDETNTDHSYLVTVKADDSRGGTDTIAVTISVTDVTTEKPLAPAAPSVSATEGSSTELDVTWTAPSNTGRPPITSYDLQYKKTSESNWTEGPQGVTTTSATISSLDADTDYQVQVRATNDEGDSNWSSAGSGRTNPPPNNAPEFSGTSATRSLTETVGAATVQTAVDIGAAVAATDDDSDPLTYTLEGTDAGKFTIVETSGQIRTKVGESYDYEDETNTDHSYLVTVKADDSRGGTDTIAVTINVTNVMTEKPLAPAAPSVSTVGGNSMSLSVGWTEPSNTGRPAITNYDLQYKKTSESNWTNGPQNVTTTNTSITGLDGNTPYQVRVRATNDEGDSDWSSAGSGQTDNSAPEFSGTSTTRSFTETVGAATVQTAADIGAAVAATDDDSDPLTYSLGGTDAGKFTIVSASGQIRTKVGESYDYEDETNTDHSYSVTVTADDNTATDTIAVTINVTNVMTEKPLAPPPPSVSAISGSSTSLSVGWVAPSNTGRPAITSYDLQYKKTSESNWTNGPQNVTTTSATISSLDGNTPYQVQVLATNADGDGPWSSAGSGQTDNSAPVFTDGTSATRSFTETVGAATVQTAADIGAAVAATDGDGDPLTYSLGGTDAEEFTIVETSGQIRTKVGESYDYEDETNTDHSYSVTVTADDNTATDTIAVTINVTNVMTEKPLAPAAPSVSTVGENSMSLSVGWVAPSNTGRPAITNYDLQYKKTSESNWTNGPQNVTTTNTSITGLDGNTPYQVRVRATNDEGDSDWSSAGSGQTDNSAPEFSGSSTTRSFTETVGAATVQTAVDIGAAVAATDDDSDPLTYSLGGTDAGKFTIVQTSGQIRTKVGESYDYEDEDERSYSVTVTADDSRGGTDTIGVTISVDDENEAPLAPAAPSVSAISGNTMSLSVGWTEPSNTGRPAITSYDLQYKEMSDSVWTGGPQDVTGTSAMIGSLTPETEYQVQVLATNEEGDGPWSSAGSGQTDLLPPSLVSARVTTAGGYVLILFSRSLSGTLPPASAVTVTVDGLDAEFRDESACGHCPIALSGATGIQIPLVNPIRRGQSVRVSYTDPTDGNDAEAIQDEGGRDASSFVDYAVENDSTREPHRPLAPRNLRVTVKSPGEIELFWDPPVDNGGRLITAYRIEYSTDGTVPWTELVGNTGDTDTTYTDTGLPEGTTRYYRVLAINSVGTSQASNFAPATTPTADGTPSPPRSLEAQPGQAKIDLFWEAPGDEGDSLVTGYKIEVSTDRGNTWTDLVVNTGNTDTTYEHTGLMADVIYRYRIRAINDEGPGVVSSVLEATTPPGPSEPRNLRAVPGDRRITLIWDAPEDDQGLEISGYSFRLRYGDTQEDWNLVPRGRDTIKPTDNRYTILGLHNGQTYEIEFHAINGNGPGVAAEIEVIAGRPVTGGGGDQDQEGLTFSSSPTFSVAENQTAVGTVVATDNDTAATATGYELTGGVDKDLFAIDASGVLTFKVAPDFEAPQDAESANPANAAGNNEYVVEVTADSGTGPQARMVSQVITVTVTNVDEDLTFSSSLTFSVAENQTAVGTVVATDSDTAPAATGYELTGGVDKDLFAIDASGVLTFKMAPDFEAPQDAESANPANAAGNNEYVVEVTAASGTGPQARMVSQAITVTVTNVDEDPTGEPSIDGVGEVGETLTANTSRIGDPDGLRNPPVWSYQWVRVDGMTDTDIGTDSSTYTVVEADRGKRIKVRVSFTDAAGNPEGPLTSAATAVVGMSSPLEAWIARFGRTVADQVLNAVEDRMTMSRRPKMDVNVAGQRIGGTAVPEEIEDVWEAEALAAWVRGETEEDGDDSFVSRELTGRALLAGSSFAFTGGTEGGLGSLWGRGAFSRFDGREGSLTLDGEVQSTLLGVDWVSGRATVGLAVGHSRGEGGYRSSNGHGEIESELMGVYPYGRYEPNERLSVWGVVGYGAGTLTLRPEGMDPVGTHMDLVMVGLGGRGILRKAPGDGGLELAVKPDALVVHTALESVRGSDASFEGSRVDVMRFRLGLEGTWYGTGTDGGLVPSFEIGVRHDGGDAETGFGADVGGGLAWTDPSRGIAVKISTRGLLTHEDGGFRERGFAGSLAWDPNPSSERGPSLTVSQEVGASATGGMDALLDPETARALGVENGDGDDPGRRRMEAKFGYGFAVLGDRFTGTPEIGFGLSEGSRETSLAWRLRVAGRSTGSEWAWAGGVRGRGARTRHCISGLRVCGATTPATPTRTNTAWGCG